MSSHLTEHNVVRRIAVEILLIGLFRIDFYVTTAAVDILFVFDCELDDQILALVREWLVESGRNTVELRILRRLNT